MTDTESTPTNCENRITVIENGPYLVRGNIPLVCKTQVVSEYGEPLTWKKEETLVSAPCEYELCRCGHSSNKPFCDGTHKKIHFDGAETADEGLTESRQFIFPGGVGITVSKDPTLCMSAGFCGLRKAALANIVAASKDSQQRSLLIAMVERCPSGALTYRMAPDEPDIEPDLPVEIAVTTEITATGPIAGPLWVSGGIPIERSDGRPFETRNRVTLCNCGQSSCKPLCDGTHRYRPSPPIEYE